MDKKRIVILGAGHVGSHCACALAFERVADEIVFIDTDKEKAHAQATDIADSISFLPSPCLVREGGYSDCAGAAVIVIAVGNPRDPMASRLDLMEDSIARVNDIAPQIKATGFDGVVISITNPADIVADAMRKGLGLPRERVFSTGTLLDTGRLLRILSELTGYDRRGILAYSLGEHGDSSMIPFSLIRFGGVCFNQFKGLSKELILKRTRGLGTEILNGKGSTEFGIGAALSMMAKAVLNDEKRVLPASVLLEGEYGQTGVHCGVPCVIGKGGVEKIIELPLSDEEQAQLDASCKVIREYISRADALS